MFRMRNLPKPTYTKLKTMCATYKAPQRDVIVAGIELLENYISSRSLEAGRQIVDQASAMTAESDKEYSDYVRSKRKA